MPTESIQFAPSARPAVQTEAQTVQTAAAQTGTGPVLDGPGVRVSVSGTQLDKLVAKVKGESEDVRLATAKRRIAIVLTALKALNVNIAESQKNALAQIEVLQAQLDELSELLRGADGDLSSAQANKAVLQAKIDALKAAVEQAVKDGETHRKQVEELKKTRAADDEELKAAEAALAAAEAKTAAAKANLESAKGNLEKSSAAVQAAKGKIADLKAQISGTEKKIADCAAAIGDKALQSLAAALKADAAHAETPELRETNADREKEEAKKAANDPLSAIREALDRMDEDILRTIDENRPQTV